MIRITSREKFIVLVSNDLLIKSDAIILLAGNDSYLRLNQAIDLYKKGYSNCIVITGGVSDLENGKISAVNLAVRLKEMQFPNNNIFVENTSFNTKEQADAIMNLVKKHNWKKIILVGSHYHQYRAYLTFLKSMFTNNLKLQITNAPTKDLPWFTKNRSGKRINLLKLEFDKINNYSKKGHLASFKEAIAYQQWKESQQ